MGLFVACGDSTTDPGPGQITDPGSDPGNDPGQDPGTPQNGASVSIGGPTALPYVGGTLQLEAIATSADGQDLSAEAVSWKSLDTLVVMSVEVDPSASPTAGDWSPPPGLFLALQEGNARIEASVEGVSDTLELAVAPLPALDFVAVEASGTLGDDRSCALTADGSAYCWGGGNHTLGNGYGFPAAQRNFPSPVAVQGGIQFEALALGPGYSCGLALGGDAYCWGNEEDGRLGAGSQARQVPNPAQVQESRPFRHIAVGSSHGCGLTDTGELSCWGDNGHGQFAATAPAQTNTPAPGAEGYTFKTIDAGGEFTCGLTTDDRVFCWGLGPTGQLGNGAFTTRPYPVEVEGDLRFKALTVGFAHACALTLIGEAYCWGAGQLGQLGTGNSTGSGSPRLVLGQRTYASIGAGQDHTCASTFDGETFCWGLADNGRLGFRGDTSCLPHTESCKKEPVVVGGGLKFATLSAGGAHTCGMTLIGEAYCWGANGLGQLGNGTLEDSELPVRVAGQP
jgi:alpha-tubulin suppressor-like RCC1 family protein